MTDIRELRIGQTVAFDQGLGIIEGIRSSRYALWDTGDETGTVTVRDMSGMYYLCTTEEIRIPSEEEIRNLLQTVDEIKEGFYNQE